MKSRGGPGFSIYYSAFSISFLLRALRAFAVKIPAISNFFQRAKKGCTVEGFGPCSLAEEETRLVSEAVLFKRRTSLLFHLNWLNS
jgi:hypothetical protein